MTDLATLVLAVDSTAVKAGVGELDNLTSAGKRAEAQAGKVKATHGLAARSIAQFARDTNKQRISGWSASASSRAADDESETGHSMFD